MRRCWLVAMASMRWNIMEAIRSIGESPNCSEGIFPDAAACGWTLAAPPRQP